jgi:hypothetical protein
MELAIDMAGGLQSVGKKSVGTLGGESAGL